MIEEMKANASQGMTCTKSSVLRLQVAARLPVNPVHNPNQKTAHKLHNVVNAPATTTPAINAIVRGRKSSSSRDVGRVTVTAPRLMTTVDVVVVVNDPGTPLVIALAALEVFVPMAMGGGGGGMAAVNALRMDSIICQWLAHANTACMMTTTTMGAPKRRTQARH
jgi:hypothetical protein